MKLKKPKYYTGIALILISGFFFSLTAIIGKYVVSEVYLPFLISLRFLFPALILWWFTLLGTATHHKFEKPALHWMRAILSVLSQYAFFFYLMKSNALNATLLIFTAPLFVPILSRIIFKFPIEKRHWASIIVGFAGVIMVLQPNINIINYNALIGLSSGFFYACSQLTYHEISKKTDPHSASLAMYTISFALSLIPLLFLSHNISWGSLSHSSQLYKNLLLIILIAITSISTQTFRGHAYSKVKRANSLMPFSYVAIIFSGLFDWWFFEKLPNVYSFLGATLILMSAIILLIFQPKTKVIPPATA